VVPLKLSTTLSTGCDSRGSPQERLLTACGVGDGMGIREPSGRVATLQWERVGEVLSGPLLRPCGGGS
jgi:hypothetical protein